MSPLTPRELRDKAYGHYADARDYHKRGRTMAARSCRSLARDLWACAAEKLWGSKPTVYDGGKTTKRPRPCHKCGGRYRHRKQACDGFLMEVL